MAFAALAALALAASGGCGLPPLRSGPLPWRTGETLSYTFDILAIVKAGEMSLEVRRPMFRETQIPVRARVRNTSVFAKVRRIKGTAFSWVDAKTLLPERYHDEFLENGVRKISDARLRAQPDTVTVENRYGDRQETASFRREGEVLDVLSAAYTLRVLDLRPGQEICFDLLATRRYWRVRGQVAPKGERVESAAGIFDTVRVDLVAIQADKPEVSRKVHLWFSTDARRLLVAAVSEINLGPVRVMLSAASP